MSAAAVVQETAIERALSLAEAGFYVFPSWAKDRHIPGWPTRATRDTDTIRKWFSGQYTDCWPSIYTGRYGDGSQSLLVVDVDPRGMAAVESGALDDLLPDTRVHATPRGGLHGIYAVPFPGVKSGTNTLGDGIDIRSKGGLIHFGSQYALKQAEAIADAPAALIAKCGELASATAPADRAQDRIAPDQEAAMQSGEELLRSSPRGTDGGRNVALRDFVYRVREQCATDADSTLALGLAFAAEQCDPPYPEEEARATIRSAIKSAQNAAGSKIALPEDFELLTVAKTADAVIALAAGNTLRIRRVRDLAELNPGPELWQGILPERAVFAIGALPGRSKSYVATGLCYALATDAGEYLGRKLPKGTAAVYVDVERMAATELRLSVWLQTDGRRAADLPLALMDGVRLNDPHTIEALIRTLQGARDELGGRQISIVIIDSLGAALPGQELNSSGPATMTGAQLRRIRDSLGCAVGVVAHSPKSGDETVAGSLHFDAIFDSTLFVRSDDGATGSLYAKKSNALALEEHERLLHWRADCVSSAVGERIVRVHRLHAGTHTARPKGSRLKPGSLPDRAFAVLCEAFPNNRPVTDAEWADAVRAADAFHLKKGAMFNVKRALRKAGLIVEEEGRITRRME